MSDDNTHLGMSAYGQNLICRKLPEKMVTKGGILMATPTAKMRSNYFEVLASGPGIWRVGIFVENKIKAGDVVFPAATSQVFADDNDEEIVMMAEDGILGWIKKENRKDL
jgi:co-chaperonin GroES (HSP10)